MCKINAMNVYNIQECLESYRRLLEWLVPIDNTDILLKEQRMNIVNHLIEVCDDVLEKEKKEHE